MGRPSTYTKEIAAKARWYVYELIDPKNMQTFYVGKGCGKRIDAHGLKSDTSNQHKIRKIKSIGAKNVIRRKFAYFWDEQAAYKCESDRICELLNTNHLTNISIATTIIRKKKEPIFSVKECISYLKATGWVIAYSPSKYDYIIPLTSNKMPSDFAISIHKLACESLQYLAKWKSLGKAIPTEIMSRSVKLDLGGLSV